MTVVREASLHRILLPLVGALGAGLVVIDDDRRIVLWNDFMVNHSGVPAEQVLGRNLFEAFPDLPRAWLELKFRSVRTLGSPSFTSWKQRPYIFRFANGRPVTGGVDAMHQDCAFMPLSDGDAHFICIAIHDRTEAAEMHEKVQELTDANQMLEAMSTTDPLTGGLNRAQIERLLDAEFHRAKRHGSLFSVIMFDLDHFKQVNDTYGHLAGDDVIRNVARSVQAQLRRSDLFGRYGGEEFLAILPATDVLGAIEIGERIRANVQKLTITSGGRPIPVTVSLGAAQFNAEMRSHLELMHAADLALYESKRGGRNRVSAYPSRPARAPSIATGALLAAALAAPGLPSRPGGPTGDEKS